MKKIFLLILILSSTLSFGQLVTGTYKVGQLQIDSPVGTTDTLTQVVVRDSLTRVTKITSRNDFLKGVAKTEAVQDSLDKKLNISDLPTNLTLYPTTTASDVSGYVVMVTDIHDVRYNTSAVDVSTPAITTTSQLVSQRISDAGVLIGQPGVFNITTFGNIRHLSGSGTATFFFRVYHRDAAGVETLICTSSTSNPVTDGGYTEFSASGIWNDGDFAATDRIVIKSYANRIAGGSDPVYQFQFGGATPVRTLLPVPFSVVDAGYEMKVNKQNSLAIDGTGVKYPTVDAVNAALPKEYAVVVYVNSTSPTTATIFDDENPPTINDNGLKNDTDNLYIGTDASTWVYNGSTYVTKLVPSSSNFYLTGTTTDAGNNKSSGISRGGSILSENYVQSKRAFVINKNGSDTELSGGYAAFLNAANTAGNVFQLNASNGVDLWNFSSGVWNKRFTFSSGGKLGIGTSPTATLDFGNNSGNLIHIGDAGIDSFISPTYWDIYGTDFGFFTHGIYNLVFSPQGTGKSIFSMGDVNINAGNLTVSGTVSATNYTGSATLTGTPTAPTATVGTNTTQLATTAFVQAQNTSTLSTYASKSSTGEQVFSSQVKAQSFESGGNIQLNTSGTGLISPANSGISFVCGTPAVSGWTSNTSIAATYFKTTVYTVATLPTTGVVAGTYASVSDAVAPTYLVTVIGGGSVFCPVVYNGTTWVSH